MAAPPAIVGELRTAGLHRFAESVYVTPGGVIVRLDDGGRMAAVEHDGKARVLRESGTLVLEIGDLRIEIDAAGVSARLRG